MRQRIGSVRRDRYDELRETAMPASILRATSDYQFTWTVEKLDNGKDWVQVSKTPLK